MASADTNATAPRGDNDQSTFTLHVLSPSFGVPQPLALRSIPATATVQQLKERIRDSLDAKPTDQAQRLIHRGRLLAQDSETMLEVFGKEALRSPEHQTLHLVLRDLSDARPAFPPGPATTAATTPVTTAIPQPNTTPIPSGSSGSQQPAVGGTPTQAQPQQLNHFPHNPAQPGHFAPPHQVRVGAPWPNIANVPLGQFPQPPPVGVPVTGQPLNLPPGYTPQQFAQHQRQWMATMTAQMGQRRLDELINQNQRDRAAMGTQGAQDPASRQSSGRTASPHQPDATRTFVREGLGPNGQQWRITVNESVAGSLQRPGRTGSPFTAADMQNLWRAPNGASQAHAAPNGGHLSTPELQNMLRSADVNQATRTMANAMRRNASSPSLANLANNQANQTPIPPGVTTPLIPSRAGSATGTPDPLRATGHFRSGHISQPQAHPTTGPEVYILSSPTGPRALLFNSNLEAYYSPQVRATQQPMGLPNLPGTLPMPFAGHIAPFFPAVPQPVNAAQRPTTGVGSPHPATPQAQQPQAEPPNRDHQQAPDQAQAAQAVRRPGVLPWEMRVALIWPHVWMIMRLALFIWWFTSPTASWTRWFTVISIAISLFIVNTGLLTPLVEQFWIPLRQHMEDLIPHADGQRRWGAQADDTRGPGANQPDNDRQRGPDPAQAAERLLRQRRERNANWLTHQVRRLERAGILFIASIAPGVAERHIAQIEAIARAERRRQEAEEAAAAAAASENNNVEGASAAEGAQESPIIPDQENHARSAAANQEDGGAQPAAEERLIAT
jgi:hypothetical protein